MGLQGGLAFPNASTTGATLPGGLTAVPGSATAGTGWTWNSGSQTVIATGSISNLNVSGAIRVTASNVTVANCSMTGGLSFTGTLPSPLTGCKASNCVVSISGGGGATEAVKLQFTGTPVPSVIQDCTISGTDAGTGRSAYGIDDNENMDAATVLRCNIFWIRVGVNLTSGLVQDSYIHDMGFVAGDHTDGIDIEGSDGLLTILHNTILVNLDQTSPIHTKSTFSQVGNLAITGNLLAGGGYSVYPGDAGSTSTVVTGNAFSTAYFATAGDSGAAYPTTPPPWGSGGNAWSGNYWYDGPNRGTAIAAP